MARRRRGNRNVFRGEPNGLQPGDGVGNRKPKQAQRMPPDDIGNRKSDAPGAVLPPDNIGNRIDAMPTHELSGVLLELDARKGRRNKKRNGRGETVRMGRYVLGGVNPLVAGDTHRAQKAQDDAHEKRQADRREDRQKRRQFEGGGAGEEKKGRRNDRRRQRFFDFADDDRYDYRLESTPEEKRLLAEQTVQEIVTRAGRAAACVAHVIEDGSRPKVLVTIDEFGPTGAVKNGKPEGKLLFSLGDAALMSLNYLVNKIVNRFPKDRIRLAVLPQSEEEAYRESLLKHREANPEKGAPQKGAPQKDAPQDAEPAQEAGPVKKVKKVKATKKAAAEADEAEAAQEVEAEGAAVDEAPTKKAKKKAVAKKTTAKKTTAKKAPAKKAAAKKATTKKATTKKATTKKTTAKKATTKKATKKATTKKATTKKKTTKKST